MSLFGNIFDDNTKLANDTTAKIDRDFVDKVTDFMDTLKTKFKSDGSNTPESSEKHSATAGPTEEVSTFDLSPKNHIMVDYCNSLINVHFHGQCDEDLTPPTTIRNDMALSDALAGIDELLRTVGQDFSGEEEEFQYYLQACIEARYPDKILNRPYIRKFKYDAKKFVQIYKDRNTVSEELTHDEYWATRQQLLSGKVVADWIEPEYGPIDPIFGVLLNPTLGRTGPGDSGWVHKLLFDDTGPMAYHSAVHDAFGYLITYHDIGPGYDYLGAWTLFDSHTCMAGQLSGIVFWRDALKEIEGIRTKKL